ncbi:MAG: tripartite tricarboxylate transporter substrate binding protein [Rhodobacteraceae bacterium]|nr:tripartite tricarboxylate transporter substrate binding protein [Paracoccaceae bacterium]
MKTRVLGAVAALLMAAAPAIAEYPEKAIQGIIQWGAGGSTDVVMRSITPHAEKLLGGSVVMQNMTGGVGAIALKYVGAQAADGYTLLMGAENPQLYKVMGLGDSDYSDFIPINLIARGVPLLVARPDAPYNSFAELVAYVTAHPNEVKFGSTGPGGLPSVITAMLTSEVALPVIAVPYDGDGPALTALQGGAIDVMPAVLGLAIEGIRAGRLKAIALVDTTPNAALPGLAPIAEAYPAYAKYLPWGPFFGVFVKNGTPDAVVAKLQAAFGEATQNPEFMAMIEGRGFSMLNLSGDDARAFLTNWQKTTAWLVFDAGAAKFSPADFGIERP